MLMVSKITDERNIRKREKRDLISSESSSLALSFT